MHPQVDMAIRWVPGHKGIPGSEMVDREAKITTEGKHKNKGRRGGILRKEMPGSKTAIKQTLETKIRQKHAESFAEGKRCERIRKIDATTPSKKFRQISDTLNKAGTSILTQLRTEHVPLNAYLHKFHLVNSMTCSKCGKDAETVTHYLLHCASYRKQRKKLKDTMGKTKLDIGILGNKKHIGQVLAYIKQTERFDTSHGQIKAPKGRSQQTRKPRG